MTDIDLDAAAALRASMVPGSLITPEQWAAIPTTFDALIAEVRRLRADRESLYESVIAERDEARARIAQWEAEFPCDGGCDTAWGPQEECSRHGRRPAELWERGEFFARERDDARAAIAAVRALCERYERADTERHDRVSVETLAAKVLNLLDVRRDPSATTDGAYVIEVDPDTASLSTRPATTDPLISTERSGCACIGHAFPGVRHIAACCDQPHIDQRLPAATTDGGAE